MMSVTISNVVRNKRKCSERIVGDNQQQAGQALIPECAMKIDDSGAVVVIGFQNRDGWDALDAEDRRYTHFGEGGSDSRRVRHVADGIC